MLRRGHTLSASTAAYLEKMVVDDLSPGDKLPPERVLAENLEVSRTTIREALSDLEQRRLVTRTPAHPDAARSSRPARPTPQHCWRR